MSTESRPLAEVEFIAFDLETTGLHPVASQIVEIGAVRFRADGTVLEQFGQLVDPQCEIPAIVSKVHGITNQMVTGQPTITEVLPKLIEFFAESSRVLLAHNAPFDLGFLSVSLSRMGLRPPAHPVLDTCSLARRRMSLANYKLETIGRHLRLIECERHRALDDAILLKDVFSHLISKAPALGHTADLFQLAPQLGFAQFAAQVDEAPKGYEELWQAISESEPIEINYRSGTTPPCSRTITPRSVMRTRGQIYLAAYCHQSDCDKTFRLDRILSYRRTGSR